MDAEQQAPVAHPLLKRQLRRLELDTTTPPSPQAWAQLVEAVSRAYREQEQDRYLLERAQAISSDELTAQAETLRLNQERLASLLQLSSDWVWEQDADLRVTYMSEGWEASTGIAAARVVGTLRMHLDDFDASDAVKLEFRNRLARHEAFRDLTVGIETRRGKRYVRLSGEPLSDAQGRFLGYRGVGRDATEATVATRRAEHMAHFDALTGLANRNALTEALVQALQHARWQGTRVALAFIDLDGFKAVNDHLGHQVGDDLLREMGRRLAAAARATDLVARLGGDEFVVVIERAGDSTALAAMAARLLETIAAPVRLQDRQFSLNGSIGVAVFPDDADGADALLRNADAAMYAAKAHGEGLIHFYTPELAADAADTFTLEVELREAVSRQQLVLHYQPKFSLADGTLTGVEALVRWQHPTRGLLAPGMFVPLAERRGLVVTIGRWVLREACRQMRAWRDAGFVVPHCAVNLSAHHFNAEGVVDEVEAALAQAGIEARAIEIEVTESAVMADPTRAHRIMAALTELGVGIAIDDFGTGHSSLAYLKRFPVCTLKVDRSFVRGLPADANDSAITQAVIAMARSLGLKTVAEGVETPEQLAYLQSVGCDQAQGFLLGRPQPAGEVRQAVHEQAQRRAQGVLESGEPLQAAPEAPARLVAAAPA